MSWLMAGMFLISLIMMARMQPKIEGAKAAGIEDFSFPSAAERPIQVVFGTRKVSGPNVLWYGNLQTRAIKEKIKTLFSTKKTTVGHKYFMGMQLGICHGEARLREVYFGDDQVWKGDITDLDGTSITISKPDIWGGDKGRGGVSGKLSFYSGSKYQTASSYLASKVGELLVSPLKGLCYAVLEDFYIGNSESPAAVSFVVTRMPKPPRPGASTAIGDDANPAWIVYELLTDRRFGAATPAGLIDLESFNAAGVKLAAERFGLSLVIDSPSSAGQVIDELLKVIQGTLVDDPMTGKMMLRLIRDDYNPAELFEINPSNIKSVSGYTAGSLDTAINEVRVQYISREFGYQQRTAIAQSSGLRIHKGDTESKTIQMPQVSDADIAAKVAQRELVSSSLPVKTCQVECTRAMSWAMVGDVVSLSWPVLGIEKQVMRVTSVDLGRLGDGAIRLTLVQDVFGVFASIFAGAESAWMKPDFTPEPVSTYRIIDAPAMLADGSLTSALVLAERTSLASDYELLVETGGEYLSAGAFEFTPVLQLAAQLPAGDYTASSVQLIGNPMDVSLMTPEEAQDGLGLFLIDSPAGIEWIACNGIKITGDIITLNAVKRGLFDTTPRDHQAGVKVWAVGEGHGVTGPLTTGDSVYVKPLVRTPKSTMDEVATQAISAIYQGKNLDPWRPGNVKINGKTGGQISGEAEITWRKRSGAGTKIVGYFDEVSQDTSATYRVTVSSSEKGILHVEDDISDELWIFDNEKELTGGWEFINGQYVNVPGDYSPDLTFEIIAKIGSKQSDPITITVTR